MKIPRNFFLQEIVAAKESDFFTLFHFDNGRGAAQIRNVAIFFAMK